MLEISIVSTSLITLGNELHGFDQTAWIPNAYILTYSGNFPTFPNTRNAHHHQASS